MCNVPLLSDVLTSCLSVIIDSRQTWQKLKWWGQLSHSTYFHTSVCGCRWSASVQWHHRRHLGCRMCRASAVELSSRRWRWACSVHVDWIVCHGRYVPPQTLGNSPLQPSYIKHQWHNAGRLTQTRLDTTPLPTASGLVVSTVVKVQRDAYGFLTPFPNWYFFSSGVPTSEVLKTHGNW